MTEEFINKYLERNYVVIPDADGFVIGDLYSGQEQHPNLFLTAIEKTFAMDRFVLREWCQKWVDKEKKRVAQDLLDYLNECRVECELHGWVMYNIADQEVHPNTIVDKFKHLKEGFVRYEYEERLLDLVERMSGHMMGLPKLQHNNPIKPSLNTKSRINLRHKRTSDR